MTNPPTQSTDRPKPDPPRGATAAIRPILVLIFRLLLLGVGSAIALLIGIAIAQVLPGPGEDQPLLENVLRGVARLRGAPYPDADSPSERREVDLDETGSATSPDVLPSSPFEEDAAEGTDRNGEDSTTTESDLREIDSPEAGAATAETTEPGSADGLADDAEAPSGGGVTGRQQALQQQLDQVRSERQALEEAIAQLEAQVGIPPSAQSLEARIAALEQQLNDSQPSPQSDSP